MYISSSQYRHWIFSRARLTEFQLVRREGSAKRYLDTRAQEVDYEKEKEMELSGSNMSSNKGSMIPVIQKPISLSTNVVHSHSLVGMKRPRSEETTISTTTNTTTTSSSTSSSSSSSSTSKTHDLVSSMSYLTPSEEALVLLWCEVEILRAAKVTGLDRAISATAIVLLKRFYNGPRAARLIEYPPHEFVSAALLAAIKAEACPYTEVAPLSRRLGLVDARLRSRHERLLLPPLSIKEEEVINSLSSPLSDISEAAVEADMLRNELPLMHGIRFQLTCYHSYRPLKSLLLQCISAYIHYISTSTEETSSLKPIECGGTEPEDALFRASWTSLQLRAFSFADVATLTDLPLLLSPEKIARGVLMACSKKIDTTNSSLFLDSPLMLTSSLTSSSTGATLTNAEDEDIEERGEMGAFEKAEWELFEGLRPKALEGVGSEIYNKIASFIPTFLSENITHDISAPSTTSQHTISSTFSTSSSSSTSSTSINESSFSINEATIVANALVLAAKTIGAVGESSLTARAKPLLSRLQRMRDPSFVIGTEEHAVKVSLAKKKRREYKELKAIRSAAAGEALNAFKTTAK